MSMASGFHAFLFGLLLAGSASAQEVRPSFDCTKARLPIEKEICASPELARLDAEIATAYAAANAMLDSTGRAALAASQKEFIAQRNLGTTAWDFELKDHLQRRNRFLRTIRPAKGQWAGTWGNDYGRVVLALRSDGLYDVKAEANDPVGGRWTCDFEHGGKIEGNTLVTVHRNDEERTEDPHDGWTLALTRSGDSLNLKARPGPDKKIPQPFCGVNGTLNGAYLPVQAEGGSSQ